MEFIAVYEALKKRNVEFERTNITFFTGKHRNVKGQHHNHDADLEYIVGKGLTCYIDIIDIIRFLLFPLQS